MNPSFPGASNTRWASVQPALSVPVWAEPGQKWLVLTVREGLK